MGDSLNEIGAASSNNSSESSFPSLSVIHSSKINELLLDLKFIGSFKFNEKFNT